MNEEIQCITNEGKWTKNEWENDDSDFRRALYSVYKKLWQFFFRIRIRIWLFGSLVHQVNSF